MIKYVTFKEGNNLSYSQDFSCFRDVPAGVRFEIKKSRFDTPDGIWLYAPGYGGTPYGNGGIFLPFRQTPRPASP